MKTISLPIASIKDSLIQILSSKLELTKKDAQVTIEHFIRSEQAGKHDHGLIRVSYLLTSKKFGPYAFKEAPKAKIMTPGNIHIDGSKALGYPVLQNLIEAGCEEANKQGSCVATSRAVYPSGAIGDWARLACSKNTGLLLVASSPPRVTPPKKAIPLVGTNPICIGLPTSPIPFVADCSTSAINHGTLLLAKASHQALPPNSVVGEDGKPVVYADKINPSMGIGAILPYGGSHKGFALAMAIELLVSLGGGLPGNRETGQHGVFAIFFGSIYLENILGNMNHWLNHLDEKEIRIPGWQSFRHGIHQREEKNVEVPMETYEKIKHWL